ncbi:MAG: hypothetical protein J2P37_12385 [Ktedonobacteraceae bacterium]|nr:hypothetical protein [Ktedonobacteraceae bacterium]MBO0792129.1 hypothetical protein [Ktedonobacteraceae bacterium]
MKQLCITRTLMTHFGARPPTTRPYAYAAIEPWGCYRNVKVRYAHNSS